MNIKIDLPRSIFIFLTSCLSIHRACLNLFNHTWPELQFHHVITTSYHWVGVSLPAQHQWWVVNMFISRYMAVEWNTWQELTYYVLNNKKILLLYAMYWSIDLFVCLYVCRSIGLFVCLCVCRSIGLFVCLYVCRSIGLFVCLCVCWSIDLFVCLLVCRSVDLYLIII